MVADRPVRPSPDGVFVGRERELEELRRALVEVARGRGRFFMVTGDAGIGKTRLADELAGEALDQGAQVVWGRCWEGSGAPAYWPWVQIIRTLVRDRELDVLAAQLGAGAPDVAQFVPEVRERLPQLPVPPPLDSDEARFRLFDSSASFLRNVAAVRPLVLIIDDLHAADMASLLLLRFVACALRNTPLLAVALYREAEIRRIAGLAETFAEVAREGQHMFLSGLSEPEVARVVAHAFETGADALRQPADGLTVSAIHRATDGNPFFVHEVARWLVTDRFLEQSDRAALESLTIPDRVREVVRWRLGTVPGELRASTCSRQDDSPRASPDPNPVPAGLGLSVATGRAAPRRKAYELGRALAQPQDLEQLLALATTECRELLGAEGVAVLLLDRERDELYFPYVAEENPIVAARLRNIRFPADRGIAGAALHRGKALRCDDVSKDPLFFPGVDQFTGRTTRALLCAPLSTQDRGIGVLEAVNPPSSGDFSDDDLALLDAIAHTIAEAVEQLRNDPGAQRSARGPNVFHKEGEHWSITYDGGEAIRVKDARGLSYVALLLRQPGQELHAIDIVRAYAGSAAVEIQGHADGRWRPDRVDGLRLGAPGDSGEMLDAQARLAYRHRLDDLRSELEEAQACNDSGRRERVQHEIDCLTQELANAIGLGGRVRRAGSQAERARVSVTRAIGFALKRIESCHPALWHHFARTIKTGTFCAYVPDPRVPITWEL